MDHVRDTVPAPALDSPPSSPAGILGVHLGLLLMSGIWAVNFSVVKGALAVLSPLGFNALRFVVASGVVWLVLRRRGRIPLPCREDVGRILALGVIGNVVYQLLFIYGIDRTRAGNAALLLAGTPILTAFLSAAGGHERIPRRVWAGAAATVAGMALVIVGGGDGIRLGLRTFSGDLILLGASAAWAVYTVGSRAPIVRYGSISVTAWTLWIGTAGLVALGAGDLLRADWGAIGIAAWAAVGFSGAFGIGVAYLLWYHGVRRIGNTRTAVYSNLTPVLALGVAWALLAEVPTAGQIAGAGVIIAGITLAQRESERSARNGSCSD